MGWNIMSCMLIMQGTSVRGLSYADYQPAFDRSQKPLQPESKWPLVGPQEHPFPPQDFCPFGSRSSGRFPVGDPTRNPTRKQST